MVCTRYTLPLTDTNYVNRKQFILTHKYTSKQPLLTKVINTLKRLHIFKRRHTRRGKRGGKNNKTKTPDHPTLCTPHPPPILNTTPPTRNEIKKRQQRQISDHQNISPDQDTSPNDNRNAQPLQQLRVLSTNFRSVCNKVSELEQCLSDVKPNIILGTESWLSEEIKNAEIFPNQYQKNVFRKDRNRHGGGVFIAAPNSLDIWEVTDNNDNTKCEIVWTETRSKHKNIIIGCFYRPPNSDVTCLEELQMSINRIISKSKDKIIILGGDFNLPNIDWTTLNVRPGGNQACHHHKLLEIIEDAGLHQVQLSNTREEHNLDLIFTNFPSLIKSCHTAPGLSDHDIVIMDSNIKINHNRTKPRKIFKFKTTKWDIIKTEMEILSTKIVDMSSSIEDRWETLKCGIIDTMNRNVLFKMSSNKHTLPWISTKLKREIRRKHKLYRQAKKLKTIQSWKEFKLFKSQLQKDIRRAHWDFINKTLNESLESGNNKKFWKYIKAKRTDNIGVASITKNNILHHDSKSKANILNDQFKSVFTKEDINASVPNITAPKYPSIPDLEITINGVHKLLSSIDTNKASGPDSIPNTMLKMCALELAPAIASLFQQSIDTGCLPEDWRNANITPIHKKGSRHEASNYRPVSLTSVCCKTLEHIICRHVLNHMENQNILTHLQHGFRSGHSCESQLIITIDDIMKRNDRKEQVDMAILDFSKAFDTVPHKKLLHKLENYGIRGNVLNWLKSFLTQRQQRVIVEGEASRACRVDSGVPQGTVLGPLLFLCHINDLPENVASQVRLFADDCLLYRTISSPNDHQILQNDLSSLQEWANTWGMKFNETKCYIMSIHRHKIPSPYSYTLNNHTLHTVQHNPYLGLTISDNLKWSNHIDKQCNRASSILGVIRRNLKNCPKIFKEQAYISLVRSVLEYGCIIWDPYTKTDTDRLERVQRRAARFVNNDYRHQSSVTEMMTALNWRPLKERRRDHRLAFLHKIVYELVAVPSEQLETNERPQRHRHRMQIKPPFCRTETYLQSFFPRTIRDWNVLPSFVITCSDNEQFKTFLSEHRTSSAHDI